MTVPDILRDEALLDNQLGSNRLTSSNERGTNRTNFLLFIICLGFAFRARLNQRAFAAIALSGFTGRVLNTFFWDSDMAGVPYPLTYM